LRKIITVPESKGVNTMSNFSSCRHTPTGTTKPAVVRCLIAVIFTGSFMAVQGQRNGPLQLADQYFASGEYYTAANLYGQFLHPAKKQKTSGDFPLVSKRRRTGITIANVPATAVLYKQAESYRLAHYWQEAEAAYTECYNKSKDQYIDALYWAAVCQRSLDNFPAAAKSLDTYLQSGTNYQAEAQKELTTLQFIRQQAMRPDSILYKLNKLNAAQAISGGLYAPVHITGDQYLVTSTEADSTKKEGVNPYHSRIYSATLNGETLENMSPLELPAGIASINQGAGSLSASGNRLYFSQWQHDKTGKRSSIYYSTRSAGVWSSPVLLANVNTGGFNSKQPFCTSDGKYLYFSSDRPGGAGRFDIWYAPLNEDGTAGEAVNAGPLVNSPADEEAAFLQSSSSTLVFSSNGRAGMGGFDLYQCSYDGKNWSSPENLGYPVNSARDDVYFYTKENAELLGNAIFSSDRGSGCCLETYAVSKLRKNKMLSGSIKDCADNLPLAAASVTLTDGSGKEWRTVTNESGAYSFALGTQAGNEYRISISKDLYKDTANVLINGNTDKSDPLTDRIIGSPICVSKIPVFTIKAEDVVTVFFDFDKSILKPAALSKLDSIYTVMAENPGATIQISGYTDGRGTEAYNKILSDKRARACADYIAGKGIDTSRISFVSFGACCPIEMELINGRDNAEGRSKNRRALINVRKE
jgi:OmpA-OmpF porin, OOP family